MRLRIPVFAATLAAVMLAAALEPAIASAQYRVAVRAAPRYPVGGYYYRPYVSPYFYGGWYGFGVGFGFGYPYYPGYGYGYYGFPGPYPYYYDISGSLRLQVSPRETEVFIDGYYAGTVDNFDGVFQRLNVEPGEHDLELYLPGHRNLVQKLYLQPGKTSNVRHAMQPLADGEAPPVRPAGRITPPQSDPRQGRGPARPGPGPGSRDPGDVVPGVGPADPARGPRDAVYGSISLRVQPGNASVHIDGERWEGLASAERFVVQLAAGRHVIEIESDGFRKYMTEVTVRPGETAMLNVALTRQE